MDHPRKQMDFIRDERGKFFYRTAIVTVRSWDETGTGRAAPTTNDGPCP